MKSARHLIASSVALLFISLLLTQAAVAQHTHAHGGATAWKTGMLRLSKRVWAGDVRLKSGMYHVEHVVEGNIHVIAFKSVTLPAGKGFPMWEEKAVVRVECRVEPVAKSVSNTKMVLKKNAAGELMIQEIQIAGELEKHILSESFTAIEPEESLKWSSEPARDVGRSYESRKSTRKWWLARVAKELRADRPSGDHQLLSFH